MGRKKQDIKITLLARPKLNSIEKVISKTPINSDISHDEFTLVIHKEKKYFMLKESLRAKDNQLDDIEQDNLIKQCKSIGIDEILN